MSVAMDEKKSNREYDENDWPEILKNPISKVGVFPYLGSTIHPSLDPNKMYMVLRSAEELSNAATLKSVRLKPLIDGHVMLGNREEGLTPAESKGVHGFTGQDIEFDGSRLLYKLKLVSEKMKQDIESGKTQLSLGYRCKYLLTPGIWEGRPYDAVQKNIRVNHLALVEEGRMGPDVAVLDEMGDELRLTFDSVECIMYEKDKMAGADNPSVDAGDPMMALGAKIDQLISIVGKLVKAEVSEPALDKEPVDPMVKALDADKNKPAEVKGNFDKDENNAAMDEIAALKKTVAAMDEKYSLKNVTKELDNRNRLAARLSQVIGTFDHADKSYAEVAEYGVKHLGINAQKGQEVPALEGYLLGAEKSAMPANSAMDSTENKSLREKISQSLGV